MKTVPDTSLHIPGSLEMARVESRGLAVLDGLVPWVFGPFVG